MTSLGGPLVIATRVLVESRVCRERSDPTLVAEPAPGPQEHSVRTLITAPVALKLRKGRYRQLRGRAGVVMDTHLTVGAGLRNGCCDPLYRSNGGLFGALLGPPALTFCS